MNKNINLTALSRLLESRSILISPENSTISVPYPWR